MKLPNAENAVVAIEKVRDYCLNSDHVRGKHKARVFLAACGLTADDAQFLREVLLEAAVDFEAEVGEADDYGQRYVIELDVTGPTGTARVRSAWIVRNGEDVPRFVSSHVL
jgi:hypothetical protein